MEIGPDGCIYVAEFAGFWKPGPGAKVSRYCWVNEGAASVRATPGAATERAGGSR